MVDYLPHDGDLVVESSYLLLTISSEKTRVSAGEQVVG